MPTGSKIKEIRIQKGLTQKQLGDMCGMADSAIRRYENGNANPKIETLQKIADALGVAIYELLTTSTEVTIANEEAAKMAGSVIDNIHDKKIIAAAGDLILKKYYEMLNDSGKQLAIDYLQGLTENPKYQKENNRSDTSWGELSQAEKNLLDALYKYRNGEE